MVDVDEYYQRGVGEFGRWQQCAFIVILSTWSLNAWQSLNATFALQPVNWNVTAVGISEGYSRSSDFCTLPRYAWKYIEPERSATASFHLVCGDAWKGPAITSAYFVGFFIGSGYFGKMGDQKGRKYCFQLLVIAIAFSVFFSALAPNYTLYITARTIAGALMGGLTTISFVYFSEFIGPGYRQPCGIGSMAFFSLGYILLSPLVYLLPSWRVWTAVSGLPFLVVPLYTKWLPESPKWLVSQGKTEEAMHVLETIARGNKTRMPTELVGLFNDDYGQLKKGDEEVTVQKLARTPTINVWFAAQALLWFAIAFAYYGLSLDASNLSDNLYFNVVLLGAVELPAYAFAASTINSVGARTLCIGSIAGASLFCLLSASICPFMNEDSGDDNCHERLVLSLCGKSCIALCFGVAFPYAADLFPTDCRSLGLGVLSQASRVGCICSPFVLLICDEPNLAFGLVCSAACCAALLLPDTRFIQLPDTLDAFTYAIKCNSGAIPKAHGSPRTRESSSCEEAKSAWSSTDYRSCPSAGEEDSVPILKELDGAGDRAKSPSARVLFQEPDVDAGIANC
jgi:MFS family permease